MCLRGNFYLEGKKHRLTLEDNSLSWQPEGASYLSRSALVTEIISCWLCPRGSLKCCPVSRRPILEDCQHHVHNANGGLTLEICRRNEKRRNEWTSSLVVFKHAAPETLMTWYHAVWEAIEGCKDRPRKLLVVINPVGGKKKAEHIYKKRIHPLFIRAGIEITKTKTDYKGHGTVLVKDAAASGLLKECNGIVAAGGDGLVNEIATGLFILASQNLGIDAHDPQIDLPMTEIRLGIIPSGSTDATCFASHGSSDPITAALHIIMGDRRGVDISAIHTNNQLQRIVTSIVSYGYFGDLLESSERMRCLGPSRYIFAGLLQIMKNRSYPVRMKIRKNKLNDNVSSDNGGMSGTMSCNSICTVCSNFGDDTETLIKDLSQSDDTWKEMTGKFSVVSAAISSCACRLSPQGVSPSAHLGDGQTDLILVKGSSRLKLISYLIHTGFTGNSASLDHVEMIRTNEIQFTASSDDRRRVSMWNCDGEQLKAPVLNIKVHRQKLNLFCRGVEDPIHVRTPTRNKAKIDL